jgi:chemotaxis protein methyltransferase CheR
MSGSRTATASVEELETELLLTGIARRYGFDFRGYDGGWLGRRVRRARQREGLATVSALQERILHDPGALQRFVEVLSGRAMSLFSDSVFYAALRREVAPLLRTYPFVRVWYVGCSTGEELYSLAIVLREEGLLERSQIYATDLSQLLLDRARKAIYPLEEVRASTPAYQRSGGAQDFSGYYLADDRSAVLHQALRRNVVYCQHNLASDAAFNEFQLVVCRNVLLPFDAELRVRAHDLFLRSLGKLGILALGRRESLDDTPFARHYEDLFAPAGLHRRVD